MSSQVQLSPGSILKNRYQLVSSLGEGGFARVFLAKDLELAREVALKILKLADSSTEDDRERFRREARLLAQLQHVNTARVFSFDFLDDFTPLLVMEHLQGRSLGNMLSQLGKLNLRLFQSIVLQTADALTAIHQSGIVHRDLSPNNVFLVGPETNLLVKIIDFGLSKSLSTSTASLTSTGFLVGNPSYMSPEQAQGGKVDHRSDIYSLGCIMYECLSGLCPFQADTNIGLLYLQQNSYPVEPSFSLVNKDEEEKYKAIVLRCLQKDPDCRFQSCSEIKIAIVSDQTAQEILSGSNIHAWAGPSSRAHTIKMPLALFVSLLALVCATVLILCQQQSHNGHVSQIKASSDLKTKKNDKELLRWYEESVRRKERMPGVDINELTDEMEKLAHLYESSGRSKKAEMLYKKAIAIEEKTADIFATHLPQSLVSLANLYVNTGRSSQAEPLYRKAVALNEKASSASALADSLDALAYLLYIQGKSAESVSIYRKSVILRERIVEERTSLLHPGNARTQHESEIALDDLNGTLIGLSDSLTAQKNYADAESVIRRIMTSRTNEHASWTVDTKVLERLVLICEKQGKAAEAAETRRKIESGSHHNDK